MARRRRRRDATGELHQLHSARHTAAMLALLGKVDVKIVSETLGHSSTRITEDLYQHVSV